MGSELLGNQGSIHSRVRGHALLPSQAGDCALTALGTTNNRGYLYGGKSRLYQLYERVEPHLYFTTHLHDVTRRESHTHTHTHTYLYIYAHVYTHTHIHTYICIHIYVCVLHTYTHIHIYIYIYFFQCHHMSFCGLRGPPSWAWQKCNRLLRLGCP